MSRRLRSLGEFELIRRIRRRVPRGRSVSVGIGDDAAAVRMKPGKETLFTTDLLIEGTHFRLSEASAGDIGRKALAVNISDIAAMGGLPRHAVVGLGVPGRCPVRFVDEFYRGLLKLAREFGVSVVGGDTVRASRIVVSVALLGEADKKTMARRSGAKVGDVLFVTGALGASYPTKKHLHFTPRVSEAQFLVKNFHIHAMMDISDGLASDLFRIAEESRVGVWIAAEAVPLTPGATLEQGLSDGEDFELLFALSPKDAAALTLDKAGQRSGLYHPIGKIVERRHGIRLVRRGVAEAMEQKGYKHFR